MEQFLIKYLWPCPYTPYPLLQMHIFHTISAEHLPTSYLSALPHPWTCFPVHAIVPTCSYLPPPETETIDNSTPPRIVWLLGQDDISLDDIVLTLFDDPACFVFLTILSLPDFCAKLNGTVSELSSFCAFYTPSSATSQMFPTMNLILSTKWPDTQNLGLMSEMTRPSTD